MTEHAINTAAVFIFGAGVGYVVGFLTTLRRLEKRGIIHRRDD